MTTNTNHQSTMNTNPQYKVVERLIHHLASHGWNPSAVCDDSERWAFLHVQEEVMERVFSSNLSTVRFRKEGRRHEVMFIVASSGSPLNSPAIIWSVKDDADGFRTVMEGFTAQTLTTIHADNIPANI